jgi:hypothetical protein
MSPAQGPLGGVDDGVRGVWSIVPEQGPLRMVKRKVSVKSKSLMTPSVFYDRYGSDVDVRP